MSKTNKIYDKKTCVVCGAIWQPLNRYQFKRNKTCSKVCSSALISKTPRKTKPNEQKKLALLNCAVCSKEFWKPSCWVKRQKTFTCSRVCNGKIRALELIKHSHKGRRAWSKDTEIKIKERMSGDKNPAWKGGVTYKASKGNYIGGKYVKCPPEFLPMARKDRYIYEHRLVMAKRIGRLMTRQEVVHHIDHNPLNNDISNLQLWPCNKSHKLFEHNKCVGNVSNKIAEARIADAKGVTSA